MVLGCCLSLCFRLLLFVWSVWVVLGLREDNPSTLGRRGMASSRPTDRPQQSGQGCDGPDADRPDDGRPAIRHMCPPAPSLPPSPHWEECTQTKLSARNKGKNENET